LIALTPAPLSFDLVEQDRRGRAHREAVDPGAHGDPDGDLHALEKISRETDAFPAEEESNGLRPVPRVVGRDGVRIRTDRQNPRAPKSNEKILALPFERGKPEDGAHRGTHGSWVMQIRTLAGHDQAGGSGCVSGSKDRSEITRVLDAMTDRDKRGARTEVERGFKRHPAPAHDEEDRLRGTGILQRVQHRAGGLVDGHGGLSEPTAQLLTPPCTVQLGRDHRHLDVGSRGERFLGEVKPFGEKDPFHLAAATIPPQLPDALQNGMTSTQHPFLPKGLRTRPC